VGEAGDPMTDARLPERWLNDRRLQRLSAEHYRTFTNSLLWSVANRTDGRIEREDVALVPHWSAHAAQALVDARLFTPDRDGWLIADYAATQTSRSELETLENIRARDREKKARKRAAAAGVTGECPGDGRGEVSGGSVPATAQAGRQDRQEGSLEGDLPELGSVAPESDSLSTSLTGSETAWPDWRGQGANPFEEYA
jgi:hypothetical protein